MLNNYEEWYSIGITSILSFSPIFAIFLEESFQVLGSRFLDLKRSYARMLTNHRIEERTRLQPRSEGWKRIARTGLGKGSYDKK